MKVLEPGDAPNTDLREEIIKLLNQCDKWLDRLHWVANTYVPAYPNLLVLILREGKRDETRILALDQRQTALKKTLMTQAEDRQVLINCYSKANVLLMDLLNSKVGVKGHWFDFKQPVPIDTDRGQTLPDYLRALGVKVPDVRTTVTPVVGQEFKHPENVLYYKDENDPTFKWWRDVGSRAHCEAMEQWADAIDAAFERLD